MMRIHFTPRIQQILGKVFKKFSGTSAKLLFIFTGISATIWFLIRVIPKPQRAGYPCMRAAAPIMSAFITYVFSLGGSYLLFKKAYTRFKQARYYTAAFAFLACVALFLVFNFGDAKKLYSNPKTTDWTKGVLPDGHNNPMGKGWGIFPGRVAWAWNTSATNENCTNVITNAFFMAKNNNQDTINMMADQTIRAIGGQPTVKESWNAIFKSFNKRKTGTESGYTSGQTIFFKVNNGQAGWAINMSDMSETGNNSSTGVKNAAMSGTTPMTVVAYIRQLVDSCNIPQNKIYVAEPMTHVYKSMYDAVHSKYPNVIILDKENHTNLGRTTSSGWIDDAIIYSDRGNEMPDAVSDALMNEMYLADYMVNVAALKAHARNGVTLNAKLHFGSHGDHGGSYGFGSFHLHAGLIATVDNDIMTTGVRGDYRMYRVLDDLMGHEKLGRNTVLFIVDGLWGGIEATDMPVKWKMLPFKNDFPNSLFVSQDEVALESVCLDFLRAEANINTAFKNRPFFPAVDDYLHQAADSSNWPTGFTYDPEGDGTPMPGSLGVHEHWNSDTLQQYSKNLSPDGKGIELFKTFEKSGSVSVANHHYLSVDHISAFPDPCTTEMELSFNLPHNASRVIYTIVSMDGKSSYSLQKEQLLAGKQNQKFYTGNWSKGIYLVKIVAFSGSNVHVGTTRFVVQ